MAEEESHIIGCCKDLTLFCNRCRSTYVVACVIKLDHLFKLTNEFKEMHKDCHASYVPPLQSGKTTDAPKDAAGFHPLPEETDPDFGLFSITGETADVLAGMLGNIGIRKTMYLELSCGSDGYLYGSKLDQPSRTKIMPRDYVRAQLYNLCRYMGFKFGEEYYLLNDLLPVYRKEVAEAVKSALNLD